MTALSLRRIIQRIEDDLPRLNPCTCPLDTLLKRVQAIRDGRNVKSSEEMIIPIPRSNDGVVELLGRLNADRDEVEATNTEQLEGEIDNAVYNVFELSEEDRGELC